jgi:hypothetical protein
VRPSLRFLSLILATWAAGRAATEGMIPGAELLRIEPVQAKPPPIVPTQFPPIAPVEAAQPFDATIRPASMPVDMNGVRYVRAVVGEPVVMRPGVVTVYQLPPVAADPPPRTIRFADTLPAYRLAGYSVLPAIDQAPLSRIAALDGPFSRPSAESVPAALKRNGIDRLQLTAWALLRPQQSGIAGGRSLAAGGSLGGSQAGARLAYNITRQIAASFRSSSDVGRRGGEVAAGVRVQPLLGIPVWLTAERRQRIGRFGGGRNAFAMFLEGGVYDQAMPWRFTLDGYVQGGVVGLHSRDRFIDAGLTLTRPVYKRFSAGFGVWGGAQPGLYRVDAGPRVSMRVRNNIRVHFDWRQRLAGNAAPGSGPAITLAGDF